MKRSSQLGVVAGFLACSLLGGCALFHFVGGAAQNFEYQKQVQTLPKYDLSGQRVAVIADADLTIQYSYPRLVQVITKAVTDRIGMNVPDVKVLRSEEVIAWQWRTPQWNALAYGEMAEQLDVDRVVHIEIHEFRLHPPGNSWIWEAACSASVGVIERDGFDPDMFADTFEVAATFPKVSGVSRDSATSGQIETGILSEFIQRTSWIFYEHLEPKYPDKFRPELAAQR